MNNTHFFSCFHEESLQHKHYRKRNKKYLLKQAYVQANFYIGFFAVIPWWRHLVPVLVAHVNTLAVMLTPAHACIIHVNQGQTASAQLPNGIGGLMSCANNSENI